jgi:hypothetical protein
MPTQVQRRRGTTTEHSTFTGANGELTVDTTKKTVVVHDGATAGGAPLAREDLSNVGTIAVSKGGTGATTLTDGAYLKGAGTSPVTAQTGIPAGDITSGNIAAARITNALNASGSAPIYACRAWVNFNGTGTVAIRASGNVSSITDNGTGDYTVNFTTALPDANYAVVGSVSANAGVRAGGQVAVASSGGAGTEVAPTTTAIRFQVTDGANTMLDPKYANIAIFR